MSRLSLSCQQMKSTYPGSLPRAGEPLHVFCGCFWPEVVVPWGVLQEPCLGECEGPGHLSLWCLHFWTKGSSWESHVSMHRSLRLLFRFPSLVYGFCGQHILGCFSSLWLTILFIVSLIILAWIFMGGTFRLKYQPLGLKKPLKLLLNSSLKVVSFWVRYIWSHLSSVWKNLSSVKFCTFSQLDQILQSSSN